MAPQHQPVVARPPLTVNPGLATHKNFSRQNSLTKIVETPVPQPDEAVLGPEDEKEKAELKRDEERRSIFQKFSNDVLHVPSGYRKVEVLIIRWDESIDDFKGHNNEIERLKMVFQAGYHFNCKVAAIKDDKDPQVELNWQMLSHIREHDDDDTLLIVYYTGHGNQVVEENNRRRLELVATQTSKVRAGCHMPSAYWDSAEAPLRNLAKGDVLAILDCCFASTAALKNRSPETRTYQMLAASSVDGATCGPGATSFTTALCDSLEELLEESKGAAFPVLKLLEQINIRRPAQPALLWDRLRHHNERSVMLSRLDSDPGRVASFRKEEPEKASLVLRLSLREAELKDQQIEDLARTLPGVCLSAGVKVRRMEWVKMQRRDPNRLLSWVVEHWAGSRSTSSPAVLEDANVDLGQRTGMAPTQAPPPDESNGIQRRVSWADAEHGNPDEHCCKCRPTQIPEKDEQPSVFRSKVLMMVCLLLAVPYTIEDRVKMILLAICIALVLTRSPQTAEDLNKCLRCHKSNPEGEKRGWMRRLSAW